MDTFEIAFAAAAGVSIREVGAFRLFCFSSEFNLRSFGKEAFVHLPNTFVRENVGHKSDSFLLKKKACNKIPPISQSFNFYSCNILLIQNNTVSHIYTIVLYITKIAMLYY